MSFFHRSDARSREIETNLNILNLGFFWMNKAPPSENGDKGQKPDLCTCYTDGQTSHTTPHPCTTTSIVSKLMYLQVSCAHYGAICNETLHHRKSGPPKAWATEIVSHNVGRPRGGNMWVNIQVPFSGQHVKNQHLTAMERRQEWCTLMFQRLGATFQRILRTFSSHLHAVLCRTEHGCPSHVPEICRAARVCLGVRCWYEPS